MKAYHDNDQIYSSLCCPSCPIETKRSCCKCCPSHIKDRDELGEECPLKKDQTSECKIGKNWTREYRTLSICLVLLLFVIVGALVLNFLIGKTKKLDLNEKTISLPTNTKARMHGAVATDYAYCSRIGTDLLREGGNAVDAAIAATICIAVVAPHKTGLGGGGRMMIYSHRDRTSPLTIDFSTTNNGIFASARARLPSFLRGLEFAHSSRGNLPWIKVIEPAQKLAEDGFIVSEDLANEIARSVENGMIFGHLRSGETLRLPILAETLEIVGRFGSDALYNGTLSQKVLRDAVIKDELLQELSNYRPRIVESMKTIYHNHAIYLPNDANVFRSIIEELENLRISDEDSSNLEIQMRVARTIVQGLVENVKMLETLKREKYSVVVAMDPHDLYVSIVTGLSVPLGLAHMTGAGFLLDGVGTENNLDFLTPIIFHDNKRVCSLRGVFGTDDPALAAQILYNILLRSFNVSTAVEYPRFYVLPDGMAVENDERHFMDLNLRVQLESLLTVSHTNAREITKSVNVITKHEESLSSHSDSRGDGKASRY